VAQLVIKWNAQPSALATLLAAHADPKVIHAKFGIVPRDRDCTLASVADTAIPMANAAIARTHL
jgi:hypothetical protein